MVDMTNKLSLVTAKKWLEDHIHADYFVGRCCLVVSKADLPGMFAFSAAECKSLGDRFTLPTFFCNLSEAEMLKGVVCKIQRMLQLANHKYSFVPPLYIRTALRTCVSSTEFSNHEII